jgi:hypothetical protein
MASNFFLKLGDFRLESNIFLTKQSIFIFEMLGYFLKSNISFNFPLFVQLNTGLKFSKLRLLSFPKGPLSNPIQISKNGNLTNVSQ